MKLVKGELNTEFVMALKRNRINPSLQSTKDGGVEEYHKSIKSNAGFAKSPTHTITTQKNHFMLSIIAYVKLEWLKQRTHLNHFAMKNKIYQAALKEAYRQLSSLSTPIAA